jgi:LacI family transcriptional regulator
MPIVLLNSSLEEAGPSTSTFTIDSYRGARAMVKHLAQQGHRRIAHVAGPAHNSDAEQRLRGYEDEMRRSRPKAPLQVLPGDFTHDAGYQAGLHLAQSPERPDAVFAANDTLAIGCLMAFRKAGVRVPEDVAVTGFDDIPIAHYVNPPLTTIGVDVAELGRRAFAVLAAAMERSTNTRREECIGTTLVVRKSCAVPNVRTYKTRGRKKGEGS